MGSSTQNKEEKEGKCYESQVVKQMVKIFGKTEKAGEYINLIYKMIKVCQDTKDYKKAYPGNWLSVPALKEKWAEKEGALEKEVEEALSIFYSIDRTNILKFIMKRRPVCKDAKP